MEDLGLSMVYLVSVVVAVAEAKGIYDFQLQALVAEVRDLRVVLDLDETLVCAFETSSLPAALWTQAIEGGLNCLQLVLKAMLDPLLTE
ncbi:hypothetical protein glysoja_045868 [Glycine soja]|uniref:FCP1 homology domain-containing protein n=1 Tax=Glycine soja TaxID=3848 RepID=A0A0B2RAC4_GLYSO|nr:hypothetical protein glysoja_045868 [Glycine soja]